LAFTVIEVLLVIAIMAVLIGITLPAIHRVRDVGYRTRCASQLRQLGVAAHGHHAEHARFPTGCGGSGSPQPYVSWITQLLPYLEGAALWQQAQEAYARDKNPFNNPPHTAIDKVLPVLNCPADGRTLQAQMTKFGYPVAFTGYLGVSGDRPGEDTGMLYYKSKVQTRDVTDGCSNTIIAGERPPSADFVFGWWYAGTGTDGRGNADYLLNAVNTAGAYGQRSYGPFSFAPGRLDDPDDAFHFWSLHLGGGGFLFADGSTRFLSYSAASILPALATRAGREVVTVPE
jgi:type II secretory pathway pseudopilin PulG